MPDVQTFNRDMIEAYLKKRDIYYLVDRDGDYRIDFKNSDRFGCEVTVWLISGGNSKEIYKVMVVTDRQIEAHELDRAVRTCNEWNKLYRWPKAYVHAAEGSSTGSIILENDIDLEAGIHQELFDDFTDTMISSGMQFWEWAHSQQGF